MSEKNDFNFGQRYFDMLELVGSGDMDSTSVVALCVLVINTVAITSGVETPKDLTEFWDEVRKNAVANCEMAKIALREIEQIAVIVNTKNDKSFFIEEEGHA